MDIDLITIFRIIQFHPKHLSLERVDTIILYYERTAANRQIRPVSCLSGSSNLTAVPPDQASEAGHFGTLPHPSVDRQTDGV